ncbi:hypothetical protein D0Z07_9244 [Hyphodiscus hymeniophilus]|uniref:Nuclear distribution protein RO10 n=1 Tax=Hyphodiscus hymeniophilus TaxID=353542 RepID=A0A9P6VDJ5_9HELO|nr:hypothetical protein D0Z07_9244 [Hyphodiscus hymeniophilus]
MDNTFDITALETIDLLETRLKRIEYAVCGHVDKATIHNNENATKKLAELEHSLHQLASKSRVIQDLLRLHSRHPGLFQSTKDSEIPTSLLPTDLLHIVLASASSYPSTASRLTSIMDAPVPTANLSASLIDLQPRLAKVESLQAAQNADLSLLRERTAAIIQRWYTVDVLRAGDSWAELESRVEDVERGVRRAEKLRREDEESL